MHFPVRSMFIIWGYQYCNVRQYITLHHTFHSLWGSQCFSHGCYYHINRYNHQTDFWLADIMQWGDILCYSHDPWQPYSQDIYQSASQQYPCNNRTKITSPWSSPSPTCGCSRQPCARSQYHSHPVDTVCLFQIVGTNYAWYHWIVSIM